MAGNARVELRTAAYVPYAVGCYTRTLRGRSNYVSRHDASVPNSTHGFHPYTRALTILLSTWDK